MLNAMIVEAAKDNVIVAIEPMPRVTPLLTTAPARKRA